MSEPDLRKRRIQSLWRGGDEIISADGKVPIEYARAAKRRGRQVWRRVVRAMLAILALTLAACGPSAIQVQATAADRIAVVANSAGDTLAEQYAREGEALIESAGSKQEALDLLEAHRAKWRPTWRAWDAVAAAHDAYATALERGRVDAALVEQLREAWCEAVPLVEGVGVSLPEVVPCGVSHD